MNIDAARDDVSNILRELAARLDDSQTIVDSESVVVRARKRVEQIRKSFQPVIDERLLGRPGRRSFAIHERQAIQQLLNTLVSETNSKIDALLSAHRRRIAEHDGEPEPPVSRNPDGSISLGEARKDELFAALSTSAEEGFRSMKASNLLPAVSDILFREWDPIGVNNNDLCRDEYESYVPGLVSLLLSGADEYKLESWLRRLQSDSMGMSEIDEGLHRRVARRLLGLLADTSSGAATDRAGIPAYPDS